MIGDPLTSRSSREFVMEGYARVAMIDALKGWGD